MRKMSIAILYDHLVSHTAYYTQAQPDWQTEVSIIRQNTAVPVASEEEAIELRWCLTIREIAREANHMWAFELAYAVSSGSTRFTHWVSRRLIDGYIRRGTKQETKRMMGLLMANDRFYNADVRNLSLNEAITRVTNDRPSRLTPVLMSLFGALLCRVDLGEHIEQSTQEAVRSIAGDLVRRVLPGLFERAEQPVAEQDYQPIDHLVDRLDNHSDNHSDSHPVKPAGPDDPTCQICLEAVGDKSCKVERCTGLMCARCFHMWFKKSATCPFCRQVVVEP